MTQTPSAYKRMLKTRIGVLQEIIDGLDGKPFTWGEGARMSKRAILNQFGIELVTKTAAKKRGHELNARAKPVGSCYFGRPIQAHADVYILDVQTYRVTPLERGPETLRILNTLTAYFEALKHREIGGRPDLEALETLAKQITKDERLLAALRLVSFESAEE